MQYITAKDAGILLSCTPDAIRQKQHRGQLKVVGRKNSSVTWCGQPRRMMVNLYDKNEVLKLCQT